MLRKRNSEQRIAVIDWETAAVGPGVLDLVSLSAGDWSEEERVALWHAYFEQYQADTGSQLDWEAFRQDLGRVSLYHALGWLMWWQGRSFSRNFGVWVKELDRVLREHFAAVKRSGLEDFQGRQTGLARGRQVSATGANPVVLGGRRGTIS